MLDRFEVQVGGVTVIFTQVTAAVLFNFIRICRATFASSRSGDLTVHASHGANSTPGPHKFAPRILVTCAWAIRKVAGRW